MGVGVEDRLRAMVGIVRLMRFVAQIVLVLFLGAGCARGVLEEATTADSVDPTATPRRRIPRQRRSGTRIPAFSGTRPADHVRVDDVLWMSPADADAYGRGWVRLGPTYAKRDGPGAASTDPSEAFVLRTDHVVVRTNLPWAQAFEVTRMAEAHATRFMLTFGDVFDLYLPDGPLAIEVHAHRTEFDAALRSFTSANVSWGAYYDARRATVVMSTEPAARGALPWLADLRHELTHQILDLSRPSWKRGRTFPDGWLWLWEGLPIYGESLGDGPRQDTQALRLARFRRRIERNEHVPLAQLIKLPQSQFEGRHYDQTAALMRYLLDPARPLVRRRTLRAAYELLQKGTTRRSLESVAGLRLAELERRFLATYAR